MKLEDLLVSYKLVKPEEPKPIVEENYSNKFERMLDYLNSKQIALEPEDKKQEEPPTGDEYGFLGWTYNPDKQESTVTPQQTSQKNNIKGSQHFNNIFNSYLLKHPENKDTLEVLTAIAGLESNYDSSAKNPYSSAKGYFQFLDSTARNYGTIVDINDPESQIDLAVKYYRDNEKLLKYKKDKIKKSGLTPLLVMYGMWWRPKSMLNYLDTGKDTYVNTSDNMTLEKILNRAKI